MKMIKVAGASLNQTPLDWIGNRDHILEAIKQAQEKNVSILCLPELCISGYGCEDAFQSANTIVMSYKMLADIIPKTGGIAVSVGLPIQLNNVIFNAACLIVNRKLLGFAPKKSLAGDGVHYEPRWFKPWKAGVVVPFQLDEPDHKLVEFYPYGGDYLQVGDLVFDIGGVTIGFEMCEEAWTAKRSGGDLAARGVDVVLNPSASHFAFGKHKIRKRLVQEGSRALNAVYVYSNLLGNEAGRIIYDGDVMIATRGEVINYAKRFSYEDVNVIASLVDVDVNRLDRAKVSSFYPQLLDDNATGIDFEFRSTFEDKELNVPEDDWEKSDNVKFDEFLRAECLGLFDYMRKSKSNGYVVSLSGGADSSTAAVLVSQMVRLAVEHLTIPGFESFKEKLSHILELKECKTSKEVVQKLLTCVYQKTENSSEVTLNAASELSKELNAKFYLFDIIQIVKEYVGMVTNSIGRALTWEKDDMALQNIQARVRAPGVWLIANIENKILLTTSNRSEAAVGYATMDGDTSGGLCPIGGIDKAFLRDWLKWMENKDKAYSDYVGIKALSLVNNQQPTAELRPLDQNQTDEKDLMPYPILDFIEKQAIRDKRSPLDIYQMLRTFAKDFTDKQKVEWVIKFFTLWCRNQWKRERYAPSFHLDDENLDPKTWCRFPILSGNFQVELAELKKYHNAIHTEADGIIREI